MLVAGSTALARLTDEERGLLREAAATTSVWVGEHREHEDTAVATHCRNGGILVLATASDVAEIVAAAAPVYAELEADPLTKRLIGEIRAIVDAPREQPAYAPEACGSLVAATAEPPASLAPADDPSALNGSYRADISVAYLVSKGLNKTEAGFNGGIFTITFKDGVFSHHLDRDDSTCIGTYTVRARGSQSGAGCPTAASMIRCSPRIGTCQAASYDSPRSNAATTPWPRPCGVASPSCASAMRHESSSWP